MLLAPKLGAFARHWPRWCFMVMKGERLELIEELEQIELHMMEMRRKSVNFVDFDFLDDHQKDSSSPKVDVGIVVTFLLVALSLLRTQYERFIDKLVSVGGMMAALILVVLFLSGVVGGGSGDKLYKHGSRFGFIRDTIVFACFAVSTVPFTLPWIMAYFFPHECLIFLAVFGVCSALLRYVLRACSSCAKPIAAVSKSDTLKAPAKIIATGTRMDHLTTYLGSTGGREWLGAFLVIETLVVVAASIMSIVWENMVEVQTDVLSYRSTLFILVLGFLSTFLYLQSFWLTYAAGGQWMNFDKDWSFYQPFEGGLVYIILQFPAWSLYGVFLSLAALRLSPCVLHGMILAKEWELHFDVSTIEAVETFLYRMGSLARWLHFHQLPTGSVGMIQLLAYLLLVVSLAQYKPVKPTKPVSKPVITKSAVSATYDRESDNPVMLFFNDVLRTMSLSLILFMAVKPEIVLFVTGRFVVWFCIAIGVSPLAGLVTLVLCYIPSYFGTPSITGRRSKNLEGSWISKFVSLHYRFTIVRNTKAAFKSEGKYLFGYHPHGLLPPAASYSKMTDQWRKLFPGITPLTLSASITHFVPMLRDLNQLGGAIEASKLGLWNSLAQFGSVILVPGGQHEMLLCEESIEGVERISSKHQGFIRIALRRAKELDDEPMHLVPVFAFNERSTIRNLPGMPLSLQKWFVKHFRSNAAFFPVGRFNLPSVPGRANVTMVVGEPIVVPVIQGTESNNPTKSQVELLHRHYFTRLKKLFDQHKSNFAADPKIEMEFDPHIELIEESEYVKQWDIIANQSSAFDAKAEGIFSNEINPGKYRNPWQEQLAAMVIVFFSVFVPHSLLD